MAGSPGGIARPGFVTVPTPKPARNRSSTSIIKGHCRFHIIAMSYIRIVTAVFHDGHLSLCIGYNLYRFDRSPQYTCP